jgi:hypothetical protein
MSMRASKCFGGKSEDSVHHTDDDATEESGRVGGLGRQVKVEVELFFEEADLEGIVGKKGNAQVKEIDGGLTIRDGPDKSVKAGDALKVSPAGGIGDTRIHVTEPDAEAVVYVAKTFGERIIKRRTVIWYKY